MIRIILNIRKKLVFLFRCRPNKTFYTKNLQTYEIKIYGVVQGVGFRPFVYRIAQKLCLNGWVKNTSECVEIQINCKHDKLTQFIETIKSQKPPASEIFSIEFKQVENREFNTFEIIKSSGTSEKITEVSPDIAVCSECLTDLEKQKHRVTYPLINCTNCGPRFSIIKSLPYDREQTTMSDFAMCDTCEAEYKNVLDRRFHAQPIACNNCGPRYDVEVLSSKYKKDKVGKLQIKAVLEQVGTIIDDGGIVAIKGTGGYHLVCSAFCDSAVNRVRSIKKRETKPLAIMFRNLQKVKEYCQINKDEEDSLISWRRPIVLLGVLESLSYQFVNVTKESGQKEGETNKTLSCSISKGLDTLGVCLASMPFHYLLFNYLKTDAIVFTSLNSFDDPVCISNLDVEEKYRDKLDAIISYNREIYNRVDDSVVCVVENKERLIRRSRGYAPSSLELPYKVEGILAMGAELANTFCIGKDNKAILSQHIGDLKSPKTYEFYRRNIETFSKLFNFKPSILACDMHPDYLSTQYANKLQKDFNLKLFQIQHHHAHIVSCMSENGINNKVIGVAFDGTGFGDDGNIWGSDFLVCDLKNYKREFHLEYIPLPGGDICTSEISRTAVSYLIKSGIENIEDYIERWQLQSSINLSQIKTLIDKKINTPLSCSMGRVFDAVAALSGVCTSSNYNAEAPMRLESQIQGLEGKRNMRYEYIYTKENAISLDLMICEILADVDKKISASVISWKFHNTIIDIVLNTVQKISRDTGLSDVVLSGGVFQNKYLLENSEIKLRKLGFNVYVQSRFPANDGGISLGQIAICANMI
jgi:hydrogenase maturation protein HypF